MMKFSKKFILFESLKMEFLNYCSQLGVHYMVNELNIILFYVFFHTVGFEK